VPKQLFGQRCENTNQCQSGLVCSSIGAIQNVCLFDQGGKCASNNDCANTLYCNNGLCGCQTPQFSYNKLKKSCVINNNLISDNLGSLCYQDSDCNSPVLFCDTSVYGNSTYTCRFGLNQNCLQFSDCVNNLQCGYSLTCGCVYDIIINKIMIFISI
jgi:hypothetical protein